MSQSGFHHAPSNQEKVWPIRSCEFQKILTRNHNKNSQFEVNDEPAIGHTLPTLTPPRDHIVRFRCNGSALFLDRCHCGQGLLSEDGVEVES
jgi:hypothetical protein